jgi:chemotaxis protein methyltransferase CheR
MDASLKERIVFAHHDLAMDKAFGEMHFVVCRNVLIYFDRALQGRALELFTESLADGGFLCLGTKEDLHCTGIGNRYEVVNEKATIYRKKATL